MDAALTIVLTLYSSAISVIDSNHSSVTTCFWRRCGSRLWRADGLGADFGAASVAAAFLADVTVGVRLAEIPFAEPEIRRRGTEAGSGTGSRRRRRRRRHETHRLNAFLTSASWEGKIRMVQKGKGMGGIELKLSIMF